MENALSIDAYLSPERWNQMEKLAQSLVQSKAFPKSIQNAAQALVVMQAGMEMGLKPIESINGLSIINGVVSPWGKTTVRLIKNHGWKIEYKTLMERGGGIQATVSKDDEKYTDTLYFDQAEKSGWTHMNYNGKKVLKPGWYEGANREMKLRYGVISKIIKTYLPEVMGSAGDIAEIAEDYVIIEEEQPKPKGEQIITKTDKERKEGLAEFIKKEKEKAQKPTGLTQKDEETAKKTVEMLKNEKKAEEGEVVEEGK